MSRFRVTALVATACAAAAALSSSACTFVVLSDAQARKACEGAADCAPGFGCVDGSCESVSGATSPPPLGTEVGPEGGAVRGPDGVVVTFAAGALDAPLHVTVDRVSSTTAPVAVVERSRFYAVRPAAILVEAAEVAVPLTGPCPDDTCAVWLEAGEEDEPWIELDSRPATGEVIVGELPVLGGVFVAGEAQ